ncbi:chromosome segregation protein SMC [Streptococcus moroccensis]|uniref:Chromosome partition protein Smc n=1 Tax=Streptococcus moroccensis TaxID=1451356 RepID=A0ABT9YQE8_9STRE|nr:chromosome segregation protein SMC [Streptococcus moroccensis]MDQ0222218.1 chromosome segregation protein [Streptococcus moroccensis]
MFLKEIHMQGFKSFADKTKVVFDQGVTAVVGPNGSGKSNITESLRWALGESSAKSLRGGKMPDVIFAGTENRKPLNFASVTVVLDNKDQFIKDRGSEIKVERQIYRNGDSEYLIDGKKVRLRDVHDLFMDTGLGRDSFSIISQGRVEAIFNSKPEERRAIFEEAAGVLKYKTRKKETESKLNQTQDNLDRLEDIIYELDGQIGPLTKQAETAKQFLTLDDERQKLYLDVLVAQIKGNKTQLTQQEASLAQVQAELKTYYGQQDQMEQENQDLKRKRQDLQRKGEALQSNLVRLTGLIADLEGKIALHELEANQNASTKAEAQERLERLKEQEAATKAELAAKQQILETTKAQLAEVEENIEHLSVEIQNFSEDPDTVIETLREKFVLLMQEEAETSNQLTALDNQAEHLRQASASQAAELAKWQDDLKRALEEQKNSRAALDKAKTSVQQLLAEYQTASQKQVILNQTYQEAQEAMFSVLDQLKTKQAREQSLQHILKNHSNFYAGVRSVLKEASRLGDVVGAVSDHLSFETKYQTALEIALGGASQNIIVANEEAATRAIAFLKKNRQGRATFLPLTTIKPRYLSDHNQARISQQSGFLGMAADLVRFDREHANIFQNLLGLTAIFETLEQANHAARQTRFQVRIVTLDGSEIRPGGAYAGGANRQNNSSFIKPELEQLTAEITTLQASLKELERQVAEHKSSLQAQEEILSQLKQRGETARLAEQKSALEQENKDKQVSDLENLIALHVQENGVSDLKELDANRGSLKERLVSLSEQKETISKQIEQVKGDKDTIEARLSDLNNDLSQARVQESQLKGEVKFAKTEETRLVQEMTRLSDDMTSLEAIIARKATQLTQEDNISLTTQLAESQARKDSLLQEQIRHRFELEDVDGQSEDLAMRMTEARSKNEELIRSQTKLEAEIEHLSDRLRSLLGKLTEQFQLSFEAAEAEAESLDNLAQAEQTLKQLEGKIRRLGPINLDAIAQFEEVSERLQFLNSQRDDLLSAKNLLLDTIQEMDQEVKERFQETFEAIRASFQQTFRQMFGGGSADLILTESDLLSAGIEISVQPPGKKIQSLNLMSGGEKALSALALLFAIIRVKTIPFVILDEVEAALDEANVKRFGDYLNRFDKSSQFIVVTHRKGTMAAADAMYGVTMQESGVSKIVSVKLKDLEKEQLSKVLK